jgi:NADH dehydrogenase (ubiquinone) 1 alpha subcomplex subunit 2
MNQSWRSLVNKNVRELRFIFCQSSSNSIGIRSWVNQNFVDIKKSNPDCSLLIRECENVEPNIIARYDYGVEKKVYCEYASPEEVEDILSKLVSESEKINSSINNKI